MTSCELLCKDNEIATQGVNKKSKVVLVYYLCDRVDFCDAIVLWILLLMFCSCPGLRPQSDAPAALQAQLSGSDVQLTLRDASGRVLLGPVLVRVVAAFAAAGDPGVIAPEGRMLDRPHLERARGVIARAAAAVKRT